MNTLLNDTVSVRLTAASRFFFVTFAILLTGLTGCTKDPMDDTVSNNQAELLAELESNQLKWSQSGVTEYEFTIQKTCEECPSDIQNQTQSSNNETQFAGLSGRSLSAREDDRKRRSTSNDSDSVRVESLFTDLRQAISQNAVRQVTFDPEYGFPQNVVVNNAALPNNRSFSNNRGSIRIQQDDDDDNRNPVAANLSFQTRDFQVLARNPEASIRNINGQFIRQINPNVNNTNQLWVVDDDGEWNQVTAPSRLVNVVNAIPDSSRVNARGRWQPGGINGRGVISLQEINENRTPQVARNLGGTLFYNVQNNSFDDSDFYITNPAGQNVFLNLPNNLRNQAFQYAGQQVNLNGSWTPSRAAPNARFNPTNFTPVINNVVEQISGVLVQGNSFQLPGLQQSNYVLIDDYGSALELQISPTIISNIYTYVGQRVNIIGSRINAGAFGQQVISVQSITPQQNVFTNTQISGVVTAVLPANPGAPNQRVLLALDTGNTVTVTIPGQFLGVTYPYAPLSVNSRISASGVWLTNNGFGQSEFEVRAPVQVTDFINNAVASFSGFISGIGNSSSINCSSTPNSYTFTSNIGQQFQLMVDASTLISGLTTGSTTIPYQAQVDITGLQLPGNIIQAQQIIVTPQYETTISGTVVDILPSSIGFDCTGPLNTYRVLDTFGNAYLVKATSNSMVHGSQGNFLLIGDIVQATGSMSADGTSFNASHIYGTTNTNIGFPPVPVNPNPVPPITSPFINGSTFVGTITGLDCPGNIAETYNFVDTFGTLYKLSYSLDMLGGALADVGSQLQVIGTVDGNRITASQVTLLATFADSVNRIPVSGTILSTDSTEFSNCNTPVYTYNFRSDNGQVQKLRLTYEAALHLGQPILDNTRVTVISQTRTVNTQLIDALEIQYENVSGQPFGNQSFSSNGTITAVDCNMEYFFVDQNGQGYKLQVGTNIPFINLAVGSKVFVTGQMVGNSIIASNVATDTQPIFTPPSAVTIGTLGNLITTDTLGCGVSVSTYNFINDNGRSQRLRITTNPVLQPGQFFNPGSRVVISSKIESFDGNTIDALAIQGTSSTAF